MDFRKVRNTLMASVLALSLAGAAAAAPEGSSGGASELRGDTVEYDMKTGEMRATGNVVMKHNGTVAYCSVATYNTNTQQGRMEGGVSADKDDMHLVCDVFYIDSQTAYQAEGNVQGTKVDRSFRGPRAEYFSDQDYLRMTEGGTITTADGVFNADFMEGWLQDNHCKGVGNAHIISPAKNFEGGGDTAEYFGKDSGRVVLTGNAWGVQNNNTLRSERLTVYLSDTGQAAVKPGDAAPAAE